MSICCLSYGKVKEMIFSHSMVKAHCHLFAKNGDGFKYEYEKTWFCWQGVVLQDGGGELPGGLSEDTFIHWLLINKLINHCSFFSRFNSLWALMPPAIDSMKSREKKNRQKDKMRNVYIWINFVFKIVKKKKQLNWIEFENKNNKLCNWKLK